MEVGAQEGKRGEITWEARVLCALVRSVCYILQAMGRQ